MVTDPHSLVYTILQEPPGMGGTCITPYRVSSYFYIPYVPEKVWGLGFNAWIRVSLVGIPFDMDLKSLGAEVSSCV